MVQYTYYKINVKGLIYIGSTTNLNRRIKQHINVCYGKDYSGGYFRILYCHIRKNKIQLSKKHFKVIETLYLPTHELARRRERYWVDYYDSANSGLNDTLPWVSDEEKEAIRSGEMKRRPNRRAEFGFPG